MSQPSPQQAGPFVLATHTSRHTPRCIDCAHYRAKEKCNHPSTAVDIITGEPVMSVYAMRTTHAPVLTADAPVRCGMAGKLFEQAEEKPANPDRIANDLVFGTRTSPRGDGPSDYTALAGVDC